MIKTTFKFILLAVILITGCSDEPELRMTSMLPLSELEFSEIEEGITKNLYFNSDDGESVFSQSRGFEVDTCFFKGLGVSMDSEEHRFFFTIGNKANVDEFEDNGQIARDYTYINELFQGPFLSAAQHPCESFDGSSNVIFYSTNNWLWRIGIKDYDVKVIKQELIRYNEMAYLDFHIEFSVDAWKLVAIEDIEDDDLVLVKLVGSLKHALRIPELD